jgi:Lytic polysaccharide mono-oxygenase, cellulose-degrading
MRPFATATLAFATVLLAPCAHAHFRLLEPASWIEESNLGDPQKAGPCGTSEATTGKPTNQVTRVQGGQKIKIRVQETIFHPGFYRVALSVNSRTELPPDPKAETKPTDRGAWSVSGAISYPPMPPILADGLFQHTSRVTGEMETEVEIPNITCQKCTLQVIQFMADHGPNKEGDYTYHHCADIQIRADPYKAVDSRYPTEKK